MIMKLEQKLETIKIKIRESSEKIKIQRVWKEREKVLEQILCNSVEFYGSIKGIASNALPELKMLESTQDSISSPERVD